MAGWQAGRATRTLPRKEESHGRQDTEATPEAEEAKDADLRDPLGRGSASPDEGPDRRRDRGHGLHDPVGRLIKRAQAPAAPVLPGASSGTAAAQRGQVPGPGSNVGISSCHRPWTG